MKQMLLAHFVCALILAHASASAFGADLANPEVRTEKKTDLKFTLHGIAILGSTKSASIAEESTKMANWFSKGQRTLGFTVTEISDSYVVLTRNADGSERKVYLEGGLIKAGNGDSPAKYSKAWINSKANPMLINKMPVPGDILRRWGEMSTAEKKEVEDFYLNYGWRMTKSETQGAGVYFVWQQVYGSERYEISKRNFDSFVASLNPELRQKWDQFKRSQSMQIASGKVSAEQAAEQERRKRDREAFFNSLSAEQKAAYDGIDDFTKADWSK